MVMGDASILWPNRWTAGNSIPFWIILSCDRTINRWINDVPGKKLPDRIWDPVAGKLGVFHQAANAFHASGRNEPLIHGDTMLVDHACLPDGSNLSLDLQDIFESNRGFELSFDANPWPTQIWSVIPLFFGVACRMRRDTQSQGSEQSMFSLLHEDQQGRKVSNARCVGLMEFDTTLPKKGGGHYSPT
jgi:hypothetical protein